ncbi:uncharacterized protein LOC120390467 [Mauremys reevesii]|uniref:uncharacterized protein LOC120390467 n=1 Tax=Mauremys reevesii TaxID=260615 RepID=UPI00193ED489|nr:uncharacterized protein LOC120390467 [Mauremys reevesii]
MWMAWDREVGMRARFHAPVEFCVVMAFSWVTYCVCRGIIQEQQPEEKLAEVDLSRLEILLSGDQQSSAFCLPHNCLTKGKEVTCQCLLPSCHGKRARTMGPQELLMPRKSCPTGSGTVATLNEITVCFGDCSAHGPPCSWCACTGIVLQEPQPGEKLAEVDVSSLDILLKRHEQSSAFSLLHNYTSQLLGARLKPKINAG